MDDPLIPLGLGGWFRRIGGVVGRSWLPLLVFQLVLAVWGVLFAFTIAGFVQSAVAWAGAGPGEAAPPPPGLFASIALVAGVGLLGAVLYSLLLSASVFVVIRAAAGLPATLTGALRFGATRTLALLGWGVVAGLLLAVGFAGGLLPAIYLTIVPAIYLAYMSIVFTGALLGVVVVERGHLGRCFTLVNPRFWPTTGRLVLVWLIYVAYSTGAVLLLGPSVISTAIHVVTPAATPAIGSTFAVIPTILEVLLGVPVGVVGIAVVVVTYAELRFREHNAVSTAVLATELDGPRAGPEPALGYPPPPSGANLAGQSASPAVLATPPGRPVEPPVPTAGDDPSAGSGSARRLLPALGLVAVALLMLVAAIVIVPRGVRNGATATPSPAALPTVSGPAIPAGPQPTAVAIAPDGRHAYLTIGGTDTAPGSTVAVLDTTNNTIVVTIGVGAYPWAVALTQDGRHAYVTNRGTSAAPGTTVSVIDTTSNTVTATIGVGNGPLGAAIAPDGRHAYIANSGDGTTPGSVSVLDTTGNTVTATIPVGIAPTDVALSPDGRYAYVTNSGTGTTPGSVSVLDTISNTVTATIPVGVQPSAVATSPDGAHAYVTNGGLNNGSATAGTSVSVIDTASRTVTATIPVGVAPTDVALSPNGHYAYVTNGGVAGALGDSVTVIDTTSNIPIATVVVGTVPTGVAITPDGHRAYIANYSDSTISVINTGSG